MTLARRRGALLAAAAAVVVTACASASAGVILSPAKPQGDATQLFTLAAQTDSAKAGRQIPIKQVDLFVPQGFAIDSFEPTAGWEQDWTIQSVQKSTWTRDENDLKSEKERAEASEQDAVFHFVGRAESGKTHEFTVRETYADGSVMQWGPAVEWPGGPKESAGPGPVVEAAGSRSGDGGTSTLSVVALVVAGLALVTGAAALVKAKRR